VVRTNPAHKFLVYKGCWCGPGAIRVDFCGLVGKNKHPVASPGIVCTKEPPTTLGGLQGIMVGGDLLQQKLQRQGKSFETKAGTQSPNRPKMELVQTNLTRTRTSIPRVFWSFIRGGVLGSLYGLQHSCGDVDDHLAESFGWSAGGNKQLQKKYRVRPKNRCGTRLRRPDQLHGRPTRCSEIALSNKGELGRGPVRGRGGTQQGKHCIRSKKIARRKRNPKGRPRALN